MLLYNKEMQNPTFKIMSVLNGHSTYLQAYANHTLHLQSRIRGQQKKGEDYEVFIFEYPSALEIKQNRL